MSARPVARTGLRQLVIVVLALVAGGAAVALLVPPGAAGHGVLLVRDGPSAVVYRELTSAVAGAPPWVTAAGGQLSGAGLLVLFTLVFVAAWMRRGDRRVLWLGAPAVLVGALIADVVSGAVKAAVEEERPCRAFADTATWLACPAEGHWSFPSDHAAIAGALATGVVLLVPRLASVAVPVALVVALARVLAGVHYPHDVLAGLGLGVAIAVACRSLVPRLTGPSVPADDRDPTGGRVRP
ncbi:phosphatase PAP2 family protein [Actinoplanes sp. HUAS TT8]|uniref:phosphatase PAP2 family protein n=1 Tax=Actinoplanes sp. HUAS TT8 TaxID=3447453 RepID=UPI003F51F298